jgi:hypothetical protein
MLTNANKSPICRRGKLTYGSGTYSKNFTKDIMFKDSINAIAVTFLKTKQPVEAFKSALIRLRQLTYNSIERTAQ